MLRERYLDNLINWTAVGAAFLLGVVGGVLFALVMVAVVVMGGE